MKDKTYKLIKDWAHTKTGVSFMCDPSLTSLVNELEKLSLDAAVKQSEESSMPHEFTERDNFSGRCLICGKGKLFH